jgi:hypothetical protein
MSNGQDVWHVQEDHRHTHKVVIGSLKGRCHLEDPAIEGKIILKLFLDSIKITLK